MSGGERVGDRAVLSGENTSSSSYSGSEPCSEFSLRSRSAGPTITDAVGKRLEQSKAGDSRELSDRSHSSQQLKFYGRRKRAKQVGSPQIAGGGNVRLEAEEAGLGGCLSVDLSGQLEKEADQNCESQNGSGGRSSGNVPYGVQGSVCSRDVTMGQDTADGFLNKDVKETVPTVDREALVEAKETKILREVAGALESTGSPQLEDRDNRRKNGVVLHPDSLLDVLKGTEEVYPLSESDGCEGGLTILKDTLIVECPVHKLGRRNDSAGSFPGILTDDHVTVKREGLEGSITGGDLTGVDREALCTGLNGAQEASNKSTASLFKNVSSSSNDDKDRNRKKGAGRSSSMSGKARSELAKEDADRCEEDMSQVFEDQGTSVFKNMPLELRFTLERQKYEESVLARAEDVLAKHEIFDSTKKVPLKGKEPARCKTHWDFVLEEMVWLSKDFERERKWKLSQAKKVATRVSRSKLDVESKGLRRQKEEEQRTRRVASNIAKDVKKFWMKVEKLVMYKHQLQLEDRRKKALDKHLDFLLGQTERYSTMLAENLAENAMTSIARALPLVPGEGARAVLEGECISTGQGLSSEMFVPTRNTAVGTGIAEVQAISNVEEPIYRKLQESTDGNVIKTETEDTKMENKDNVKDLEVVDGDEDFDLGDEMEEEDDEATIAADEALITEDEKREELSTLKRESELPLEELLKLYGRNGDESDAVDGDGDEDGIEVEDGEDSVETKLDDGGNDDKESEIDEAVIAAEDGGEIVNGQPDSLSSSPKTPSCVPGGQVSQDNGGLIDGGHPPQASQALCQQVVGGVKSRMSPCTVHLEVGLHGGCVLETDPQKFSSRSVVCGEDGLFSEGRCAAQDANAEALQDSGAMIDDGEYIPATLADGVEEDDETTLEEEELLASADADDPASEVDLLKRESEMSVEELLAQYKAMAAVHDGSDDSGKEEGCIEDRQDRTSEAGTSGSSSEEDDHGMDASGYLAEAKERMGEPSTSGRGQWSCVSSGYGRKLKKKPVEKYSHSGSNGNSTAEGKMSRKFNDKQLSPDVVVENGDVGDYSLSNGDQGVESLIKGGMVTSFLLQPDDMVDADTIAAVQKISEAAKRRGERVLKRSQREQETASLFPIVLKQDDEDRNSVAVSSGLCQKLVSSGKYQDDGELVEDLGPVDGEASAEGIQIDVDHRKQMDVGSDESLTKSCETREPGIDGAQDLGTEDARTNEDKLADAAAEALSAQPTGYTYLTTKVRTKLPFLLKHTLREYQHIGLDWLVTMYEKRLNGILADEMGLGKTIMTISLLAHLACERGIWGPHLIVVPTSVMLNWETEFMKWCPAFKILTYFGSAKDRKYKRQGWSKLNSFHVCITTYRLVIQDAKAFRRKKWKYLILDEAHLIKNWKSQRWQTLLNFNSKRRILLTGTPLQNDLMELWSLMHFLMPHVFQSHQEFRDWFSNPITGMVEGQVQINKEVVDRLHNVLRPFLLRRLKQDVEKQLPGKFEHVVHCRLSKRQRNLYEDFMANSDTQATLASGNFLGLINVLMQLRKVCNHPDLFEGRPIISSFDMPGLTWYLSSLACSVLHVGPFSAVNLRELNLIFSQLEFEMTSWESEEVADICTPASLIEELSSTGEDTWHAQSKIKQLSIQRQGLIEELQATIRENRAMEKKERMRAMAWVNMLRCSRKPVYGSDLRKFVLVEDPVLHVHEVEADTRRFLEFSSVVADMVKPPLTRLGLVLNLVESFLFAIPATRAPAPVAWCSHPGSSDELLSASIEGHVHEEVSTLLGPLRPVFVRRQLFFPDRRLLQFDCGKLQELAILLRRLKSEGHRALIFTQMTRMLDILEGFISLYGYTYMRLDGSTRPEQRQILMQRFNTNPKIFLFILSTRSGGVGINLVGADTVIFYDSDWNPAMDLQAQDRCHRIGQTREVHIYRLVSESTIEENILKKANQKRVLDDLVIQSGSYNTEFFKKLDPMELFSGLEGIKAATGVKGPVALISEAVEDAKAPDHELSSAEVEAALRNAEDEADYMAMKRVEQEEAAENQEFTEETFAANMDDDDYVDEMEDGKTVVVKNQADGSVAGILKDGTDGSNKVVAADDVSQISSALVAADVEEEMDMLADVKQMAAAAAAAGRGSMSFEDQLQPVERYAMRFLELWDPRVDKASEAAQVLFEEKEWELDQLEKLKEEQEAEIDEDNEPLFYKSWDTEFANEAYRQQVEVLAQQQENQRQLEWVAMEEEMRDDAERLDVEDPSPFMGTEHFKVKSKSLKKLKKAKFKSLMKGSLGSQELTPMKSNGLKDGSYKDVLFELTSLPSRSPSQRKRKAPKLLEDELLIEDYAKRMKRDHLKYRLLGEKGIYPRKSSEFDRSLEVSEDDSWPEAVDQEAEDLPLKSPMLTAKTKSGGKISIMSYPVKKGPLVTLEKERKKDAARLQDHVPVADPWTSAEDAVLCAVVHEYGGNWQLASDVLAGMPDGSIYRGRHRHPFHCRERFRQLLARNAAAASGDPSSERNALIAANNSHLKVTEEHTRRLLEFVRQLPNKDLLLQRHFAAVLTAVHNMLTRKRAGVDRLGVSGANVVNPPDADGFVSLSNLVRPLLSSYVPTPRRSPNEKYASNCISLVGKALSGVDGDKEKVEEPGSSIAKDSLATMQHDKEAEKAGNFMEPVDEKFSISEYLVLNPSVPFPEDDDSEVSSWKYTPVLLSLEDLLGYKPPMAPALPNQQVLRGYAENIADQRFRTAMNTGWGPGVYEWAAAATSGLGSCFMLKGKPKKRPPPADSNKPPKPKQAKLKANKKVSTETSMPASRPSSTKKKKKAQLAVSLSPASNTVVVAVPQFASEVNHSEMEARSSETLECPIPDWVSSQGTMEKTLGTEVTAVAGSEDEGILTGTCLTTFGSVAIRTAIHKSRFLPSDLLVEDIESVAHDVPGSGATFARHKKGTNPLADCDAPDVPAALGHLRLEGDDEVVITGASFAPASVSDTSRQVQSACGEPFLQGELYSEDPALLDPTSEVAGRDEGFNGTRSWSGDADIGRTAWSTKTDSCRPLSNWGSIVGSSPKNKNGFVGGLLPGSLSDRDELVP